jgi:predicted RNA binding protein YcfA (HicA-like mRNA interferase family)
VAGLLPLKRREFVRRLKRLGFAGPFRGTRHEFLVHGQKRQTIPSNPEYSVPQVRMMLRQVENILGREIPPGEWERL